MDLNTAQLLSSSLAESGGFFPELELSLSPILKTGGLSQTLSSHSEMEIKKDGVVSHKQGKRKVTYAAMKDAKCQLVNQDVQNQKCCTGVA